MSESGCPGCFSSARGQQEEYDKTLNKAKAYAKSSGESVAIYREGFEFRYIKAELAFRDEYNVIFVVSKHS